MCEPFSIPGASEPAEDRFGISIVLDLGSAQQTFRWIEPGQFLMGSPVSEAERGASETLHEVQLTHGYWLADTACTQAVWLAVWPVNPSQFDGDPRRPVENVAWHDAQRFLAQLNGWRPGIEARLPTEAEWEYACRAGTATAFSFGEQITTEMVNYHGEYPYAGGEKGPCRRMTVPVASLPPNAWGLYEMHGNVWEWCSDWYAEYPTAAVINPSGPEVGRRRVLRGGTWSDPAGYARSARRSRIEPAYRPRSTGFRIVLGGSPRHARRGL